MKEKTERKKTKLKEAEMETLRNLEEQAKLSAQRLKSYNSDEVIVKFNSTNRCAENNNLHTPYRSLSLKNPKAFVREQYIIFYCNRMIYSWYNTVVTSKLIMKELFCRMIVTTVRLKSL